MIGVDIGTTAVRAAELDFAGRSGRAAPTLVRAGQVALPPGAVRDGEVADQPVVAGALKQLWAHAKFDSKDVVLGVGNQRVLVRELDLPWLPADQIKSSLAFQVTDMLPMSADEALLDYYPASEIDGPQGRAWRGLLVAAQRATVTASVLAAETAGLRPTMVDLNAFALIRALARGEFADRTIAFVDVGATTTTVAISAQGQPRIVRSIATGGGAVTQAVAGALALAAPDAENAKRELGIGFAAPPGAEAAGEAISSVVRKQVEAIRNTFVYYSGNNPGHAIDVVMLTGGAARLPGLGQYLSSASRLPVVMGDPVAGLRTGKSLSPNALHGDESLFAVSVGLAYGVAA